MATVKAIEATENVYSRDSRWRTAIICTDGTVTVQSLKNHRKHKNLIEEIKKSNRTGEKRVDNRIYMDKGTRGEPRERDSR